MLPGKQYLFKQTTKTVAGVVDTLRYQVDVNTLHRQDAPRLKLNEIGRCAITLTEPVAFDDYRRNRASGAFIVIDRLTNGTVGAGMIMPRATADQRHDHWDARPLSASLHSQPSKVSGGERSARFGQKPCTLLLTGLTSSGKSTIAYALERRLFDDGRACVVLDGQNLRLGISKDLGFSAEDRSENLRRGAEVARLMNDAGLLCIAAFVAPSEEVRQKAGDVIGRERFLVVYLSAAVEVCRTRDGGGQYARADSGDISNFPGVSAAYEPPLAPDLVLPTDTLPVADCVDRLVALLTAKGVLA